MAKEGKIFCYADDIVLICDNQEDLNLTLVAYDQVEEFNLKINKKKSAILSARPDLVGQTIHGYKVVDNYKYLGVSLHTSRIKTI